MYKKIFLQIILFLSVILLIASMLYFYMGNKNKIETSLNKNNDKTNENISLKKKPSASNLIENIKYLSKDNQGNEYEIKAKKGKINLDDPDIIFMTDVLAVIKLKNSNPIFIKSNFATYNNKNYDTNFEGNILINHLIHKISGEKLDLSFKTNLATMYDKIIYTNMNTVMNADRLEIDLITKNSKIFMNNKYEKIKLLIKQ
jgi:LPS export ABC transporter protein LptC